MGMSGRDRIGARVYCTAGVLSLRIHPSESTLCKVRVINAPLSTRATIQATIQASLPLLPMPGHQPAPEFRSCDATWSLEANRGVGTRGVCAHMHVAGFGYELRNLHNMQLCAPSKAIQCRRLTKAQAAPHPEGLYHLDNLSRAVGRPRPWRRKDGVALCPNTIMVRISGGSCYANHPSHPSRGLCSISGDLESGLFLQRHLLCLHIVQSCRFLNILQVPSYSSPSSDSHCS